ncbi:Synaptic vesicle 2-related protein [Larimichthys crocea]|uniref:Synaptic vesicle 2-related protein n=1 Tax=Larimichthys crocea TaxID=215358 RepID=A0A6G0ILJ5_LARCR|nr:Synaptic vesicle 2-related protein [Larimichthys crocea]
MDDDLFQLRQLPVVRFRRTGESARSEDDCENREQVVKIAEQTDLESVALADGAPVPREFANPTDDTFMVEDAVEAIGFGTFQWKLSILTGLSWMADAMEMMILSILAPQLHCEWRLPSLEVALLTSAVFIGMMISSSLWGNISDKYGRKTGLKMSVLWTMFYGLMSAFAPVYGWILVLRALVGFGIGGAPQSVTLYAEFLPMKSRATCILLIEIFWALGTVFEVLLAILVMPTLGWRWLLGLSTIPLFIFAFLCFWLPESARYDVLTGNQEKALATLKRIATENGAPMPLGKLIAARQEDRGKIRDLFSSHFRWTTVLLWFIWFANAFSYYGLVLLTTELFQEGGACGMSKGNKRELRCSLECKYLNSDDYKDLLWTTLSEFPGLLVTLWAIDRLGRRKTMALCFFIFSMCIIPLYGCVGRTSMTVLIFIARAFIAGGFQAAYVYTPEVYPTATRALGSGNKQWNGQSRCPHYTFCCTGDVGVICVPRSLRVLLLLPPSCRRLLCTANRDNRPGPAGVQPPRVGTGDGGPGLFSWLRENPSVQLRLAGLRTHPLEYNRERRQTTERKRGKERQRKLDQLSVSIFGPNL